MAEVTKLKVTDIEVVSNQRTVFDEAKMRELTASVKEHDVQVPLLVRADGKPGKFYLVAGERRLRAAKAAGLTEVPVRVVKADEHEAAVLQAIENLQREDLTPLEEARAYRRLIGIKDAELFAHAATVDGERCKALPGAAFNAAAVDVGKRVGKPAAQVARMLQLLELPEFVQAALAKGQLLVSHGWLYLTVPNEFRPQLDSWLKEQIQRKEANYHGMDGSGRADGTITVGAMQWFVDSKLNKDLKAAPFDTTRPYAGEVACSTCPFNTGNQSGLFGAAEPGTCRQPECWTRKRQQVYKDIRLATEKRADLVPYSFAGYGRLGFNGADELRVIGGFQVLGKTLPKEIQAAVDKDPKKREALGWALVKPAQDAKNPKTYTVWVVRDPAAFPAAKGVKSKAAVKSQGQGREKDDTRRRFNYFEQHVLRVVAHVHTNQAIAKVRPVSLEQIVDKLVRSQDGFKQVLQALGFGKAKLDARKLSQVYQGLCMLDYQYQQEVTEVLRKKHEAALLAAFEKNKDRVTTKDYNVVFDKGLIDEVAKQLL